MNGDELVFRPGLFWNGSGSNEVAKTFSECLPLKAAGWVNVCVPAGPQLLPTKRNEARRNRKVHKLYNSIIVIKQIYYIIVYYIMFYYIMLYYITLYYAISLYIILYKKKCYMISCCLYGPIWCKRLVQLFWTLWVSRNPFESCIRCCDLSEGPKGLSSCWQARKWQKIIEVTYHHCDNTIQYDVV